MAKSSSTKQQNETRAEPETSGESHSGSVESSGPGARKYLLLVQRQEALEKPETRRTAEICVTCSPRTSVLAALALARETKQSPSSEPEGSIAFEGDCFEGICGGCAMLVNGRVALACGVLLGEVADKRDRVRLAPMKSFPLVRDLVVDRSRATRTLQSVPVLGPRSATVVLGDAPATATHAIEQAGLDKCHRCGACLEACPQYGPHSEFVGALTLHEVRVRNNTAIGKHGRAQRIEAMMAPGGVQSCGKAQNCVEVCPAELPLVDSIQRVAGATSRHMLSNWLSK